MQGLTLALAAPQAHPELRDLVVEASCALARLDFERLEELAFCCRALHRDRDIAGVVDHVDLARQAKEAQQDFAVFSRVLEATRANLAVMNRIRALRAGRLSGYCEYEAGSTHGDH